MAADTRQAGARSRFFVQPSAGAYLSLRPSAISRAAETAYYRKVMHGTPNLCVVDAFLTLKENEADMLRRAFIALQYGLSPANYIL